MEEKKIDWSKWDSTESNFAKYAHVKSNLIYGHLPEIKPDVSIMTPTFRRADTLKEALDSALGQRTKYSYTITVVDNDSDGDVATDALMKDYCEKHPNILYYRNEQNIGMYGNWNRCIELAQADWLCMLHDDDMMKENTVEKLYSVAKSEKYGLICCACTVVDERNNGDKRLSDTGFNPIMSLLEKMFIKVRHGKVIRMTVRDAVKGIIIGSSMHIVRKESAISCGGYDVDFFPATDTVLYEKMIKYSGGGYYPEQLYYYRVACNLSLDLSVAYNSIDYVSQFMSFISRQAGVSEARCKRKYCEYMMFFYHTRLDYKDILDINEICERYDIPRIYGTPLIRCLIVAKYVLRRGLTLFKS